MQMMKIEGNMKLKPDQYVIQNLYMLYQSIIPIPFDFGCKRAEEFFSAISNFMLRDVLWLISIFNQHMTAGASHPFKPPFKTPF